MKKAAVYTRAGDKGTTGLVGGSRISKGSDKIDLYGEVDELNSHIGFLTSLITQENIISELRVIQHKLFDLGSNLACEDDKRDSFNLPQIIDMDIKDLEKSIDTMDSSLDPLKYFILPGGEQGASYGHICRTVCRRIERKLVASETNGHVLPKNSIQYVNRLSDYFFVLSRFLNKTDGGSKEVFWIPKK